MDRKQKVGIGVGIILFITAIALVLLGYDKNTRNKRLAKIRQSFAKRK